MRATLNKKKHSIWSINSNQVMHISVFIKNTLKVYLKFLLPRHVTSWHLNPSRGIQTRNMVFKSGSWYSNSSRGIQIRLVAFKFVSWWANSS